MLPDGRALAYLEWGDSTGYPAFYFHGTPSSRLEGAFADGAARRTGFRLIAIDRPGYGRSTFQAGRNFRDWPADVCALADAFELEEFGVVGHSGAGPHLFACGAVIPRTRLAFVGALGPWGPLATPDIMRSLNAADRCYARLARSGPRLFGALFAPLGWCAKYTPGLFSTLLAAAVPAADKHLLSDERFGRHLRAIQLEAFRQGSRGAAYESFLQFRPWGFDLAEVAVPISGWVIVTPSCHAPWANTCSARFRTLICTGRTARAISTSKTGMRSSPRVPWTSASAAAASLRRLTVPIRA